MLGVGEVRVASDGMAEFRIRDRNLLLNHIIPLFDKHRLLTSKYYHYELFKQALLISLSPKPTVERHALLADLRSQATKQLNARPVDYISPV